MRLNLHRVEEELPNAPAGGTAQHADTARGEQVRAGGVRANQLHAIAAPASAVAQALILLAPTAVASNSSVPVHVPANAFGVAGNATPQLASTPTTEPAPARPNSPFTQMDADERIEHLLSVVDRLSSYAARRGPAYLGFTTARIGQRNLTARKCVEFALETALEHRRARVPELSLGLVPFLNARDEIIPLFGVELPRDRIEAWSREEDLPTPIPVRIEQSNKDDTLGYSSSQNVHELAVGEAGESMLTIMRERTLTDVKKTVEQTNTEIGQYLATQGSPELALRGLGRIMQYVGGLPTQDPKAILATVWGYIEQWSDQEMKQNLRDAMRLVLAEIGRRGPCRTGVNELLCDIPSGIDLSLPQEIPEEEVLRELAQMAGNVNERFEMNYAYDCTGTRNAAGADENSPARVAVESRISALKRDMFLEKARIELVLFRNIDSKFVMAVAKKVFPEGAIL